MKNETTPDRPGARGSRRHSAGLAWFGFAAFVLACGASRAPAEAPAPATPPGAAGEAVRGAPPQKAAAPPAPAPIVNDRQSESDSEAAAPAAGAPLPRSARPRAGTVGLPPTDIDVLTDKLDGALSLATPDCATAWALRDRICDLADRLCDLAGRSAEPEMTERCKDGRARCASATGRVRAACPN